MFKTLNCTVLIRCEPTIVFRHPIIRNYPKNNFGSPSRICFDTKQYICLYFWVISKRCSSSTKTFKCTI